MFESVIVGKTIVSKKSILRKDQRPINIINTRHLKRVFIEVLTQFSNFAKKSLILPMKIFVNPFVTTLVVVAQMFTGAILGANLGSSYSGSTGGASVPISVSVLKNIWNGLEPITQNITLVVLVLSIVKAFFDIVNSYYERSLLGKFYEIQKSSADRGWISEYQDILNRTVIPFNIILRRGLDGEEIEYDNVKRKSIEILTSIRSLAARWDDSEHSNAYSINIMFYMNKSSEVEEKLKEHWEKNKVFYDSSCASIALSNVSGVLAVIASLNSKSTKFFEKSENNIPLMLPVRHSPETLDSIHLEIPGAPTAFSMGSYSYLGDVNDAVREWVDIDSWQNFTEMRANDLVNHYSNDKTNRSNFSMALKAPEDIDFEDSLEIGDFVGVLNLYSSKREALKYGHDEFYQFMRPFLETLTKALILQEQIISQGVINEDNELESNVANLNP